MPGSGGAICIWESYCSCGFQKVGMASVCCDPREHFSVSGMGVRVVESGTKACVCLVRKLGLGYCFRSALLAPNGVWQTTAVFCNRAFF